MLVIILLNVAQVLVREFIIFILTPDDTHIDWAIINLCGLVSIVLDRNL